MSSWIQVNLLSITQTSNHNHRQEQQTNVWTKKDCLFIIFNKEQESRLLSKVVEDLLLSGGVEDLASAKSVELRGGGDGVSAHVLKVHPVASLHQRQDSLGRNQVNAVAGRAPDRGNSHMVVIVDISRLVGVNAVTEEDLGLADLVVKHDAVEGSVHAIVDVVHVRRSLVELSCNGCGGKDIGGDSTASNHLGGEGEGRSDKVAAGLGNDTDIGSKERVDSGSQDACDLLKGDAFSDMGRGESTTDIQELEVESIVASLVKDAASADNSLSKGIGIKASTADVERDSNDIQLQFLSERQQSCGGVEGCAKLESQLAERLGVIGQDAEDQLSLGVEALDLVQFLGIVKSHHADIVVVCILDERVLLARVSVDDARGVDTYVEDRLDLVLGGAIEPCSE